MSGKDDRIWEWHRDVQVPLRQCDYQQPLIVRSYPFIPDSPEAELDVTLAASIVVKVPYWRRFKQWPDRRPPDAAYAEMRRLLLKYGYSEKDFESSSFPDIEEMLAQGSAREAVDSLHAHMGGAWPREFRKLLLSTVAVWIEKPGVMDYWREQIAILSRSIGQYRSRKDAPDPWPFIGPSSRPLELPGDMPAVYTAIARLNDRLNPRGIITEELDRAPCQDGSDYTRLMDFFPGVAMIRYGREAQYVDLDIVSLLIKEIGRDLIARGLLTDKADSPEAKTVSAGESTPDQRSDVTQAGAAVHVERTSGNAEQITTETMIKSRKEQDKYDVFLSYNSKDRAEVLAVGERLRQVGIQPWLDVERLVPGESWLKALQNAIVRIPCAAVFFGSSGVGPWEQEEMEALLHEFISKGKRVIPVLLPGVGKEPALPAFLRTKTWVDMREWQEEGSDSFDRLVCGVIGRPPDQLPVGFVSGQQVQSAGEKNKAFPEQEIGQLRSLKPAFGVLWDADYDMRCLSCGKLLKNSSIGPSIFWCSDPKCNSKYVLKDARGTQITLEDALNRLKQDPEC